MSASELHAQLEDRYSKQAIHKSLNQLIEQQVLVKLKMRYCISMSWIQEVHSFAEKLELSSQNQETRAALLPASGQVFRWKLNSALRARSLWAQLVLAALHSSNEKTLYSWNPHPWFYLVQTAQQERLLRAIDATGTRMYKIVGGNNYLDTFCASFWGQKNFKYSFSKGPFERQRSLYLSLIDSYCIRVEFTEAMTKRIEEIFLEVNSAHMLDPARLFRLFTQKTPVLIHISNKPQQAQGIKRKFERFFNID